MYVLPLTAKERERASARPLQRVSPLPHVRKGHGRQFDETSVEKPLGLPQVHQEVDHLGERDRLRQVARPGCSREKVIDHLIHVHRARPSPADGDKGGGDGRGGLGLAARHDGCRVRYWAALPSLAGILRER